MPGPQIRRWLPKPDSLRRYRSLRWLGPLLDRRSLWHADRRSIATGLAAGTFIGLTIPVAQMLLACVAALVLRANLPAAVLATFISNPLTTPAILVAGYHLGVLVLGVPAPLTDQAMMGLPLADKLRATGEPLATGIALIASAASLASYFAVHASWRLAVYLRLRRKRRSAAARAQT